MATSQNAVYVAVEQALNTYEEWFAEGDPSSSESETRVAFINPILNALGWDTADHRVCRPEWTYRNGHRVDYALFPRQTSQSLAKGQSVPAVIIEAKPVYRTDYWNERYEHGQAIWTEDIDQLQKYVDAEPRMVEGLAVFTNGRMWLLYLLGDGRRLHAVDPFVVDITRFTTDYNAETLYQHMGRQNW